MASTYLYFQPEYVSQFKCDPFNCNDNCCKKPWNILIDEKTYEKYSRLKPDSAAREIVRHFKYNAGLGGYLLAEHPCPFLTADNLCRIQREHGEDFLSNTCTTYPRYTKSFGKFFERSLSMTCPVAAQTALFSDEPMRFEFVEVPEEIHSHGGKISIANVLATAGFAEHMLEVQVALISIMQERTLTIDQRLIVVGFFCDRLGEIIGNGKFTAAQVPILIDNLKRLIETYESKNFFARQVPRMLASVRFDEKKFVRLILTLFNDIYGKFAVKSRFLNAVAETLALKPDENNFVSICAVSDNFARLADERKIFAERYAAFLENYFVNDLFLNCYPWRFTENIANNFAVFVTTCKIFELITFSLVHMGLDDKETLIKLVGWFTAQTTHSGDIYPEIFYVVKKFDDPFELMETLLEQ